VISDIPRIIGQEATVMMRSRSFLVLPLLIFLFSLDSARAGWTVVGVGVSSDLHAVSFPDSLHGWVVGTGNVIRHTTDGGLTWSPQSSPETGDFLTVSFYDSLHGIVTGGGGKRLHTNDGGMTWLSVPGFPFSGFYASCMVDSLHGWIAGSALDFDLLSLVAYLERTTDGGYSWTSYLQFADSTHFEDVQFVDDQVGWATREYLPGELFRSTNGGASWTLRFTDSVHHLIHIDFLNADRGYMVGKLYAASPYFMNTTDGGASWGIAPLPYVTGDIDLDFIDELSGWVIGDAGRISGTTDGGATWLPESSHTTRDLTSICFTSSSNGWVTGKSGTLLHFQPDAVTDVGEGLLPGRTVLLQNYPNPFNPSTTIRYAVAGRERVVVSVADVLGRDVAVLLDEVEGPGEYETTFDGSKYANGVYIVRFRAGSVLDSRKIVLMK
jgi:photosystem II stability/assembly factor-like uncharacterized protein